MKLRPKAIGSFNTSQVLLHIGNEFTSILLQLLCKVDILLIVSYMHTDLKDNYAAMPIFLLCTGVHKKCKAFYVHSQQQLIFGFGLVCFCLSLSLKNGGSSTFTCKVQTCFEMKHCRQVLVLFFFFFFFSVNSRRHKLLAVLESVVISLTNTMELYENVCSY